MKDGFLMRRTRKWNLKEQGDFLKKVGELLERGYTLRDALHTITYQMDEKKKNELYEGIQQLRDGYSFHHVLRQMNFHHTLISFAYFGEQHGSLSKAFFEGSRFLLKRQEDLKKLQSLILYPLLLLIITIVLFFIVEKVLLPQFSTLFASMNVEGNIFMFIINFLGEMFPLFFIMMAVALLASLIYYRFFYKKLHPLRKNLLLCKFPLIGALYRLYKTYYIAIHFSYLLGGGMPIIEALNVFKEHRTNPLDEELGRDMHAKLLEGEDFANIVLTYPFIERDLALIIKHGQKNGKLPEELYFYSNFCLRVLEGKIERLFKLLQPVMYGGIGFVIVSMYLAILLPMFQLLEGI